MDAETKRVKPVGDAWRHAASVNMHDIGAGSHCHSDDPVFEGIVRHPDLLGLREEAGSCRGRLRLQKRQQRKVRRRELDAIQYVCGHDGLKHCVEERFAETLQLELELDSGQCQYVCEPRKAFAGKFRREPVPRVEVFGR